MGLTLAPNLTPRLDASIHFPGFLIFSVPDGFFTLCFAPGSGLQLCGYNPSPALPGPDMVARELAGKEYRAKKEGGEISSFLG